MRPCYQPTEPRLTTISPPTTSGVVAQKAYCDRSVDYIEIGDERIFTAMEKVQKILYHETQFAGDQHYVDVHYTDRTVDRYFNPDLVMWEMKG